MPAQPNPASGARPRAVLLDAMGTLVTFEPPAPLLRAALASRGIDVPPEAAAAAIRAEIAYYRAHFDEGRDAASLAALRRACAEAMRPALGAPAAGAPAELLAEALLEALRFVAFPDAAPALRRLRAAGMRLVVVSNWDVSLDERLAETGLAPLLDGAVASAVAGAAKPDPAIFLRALALAGVPARDAWHVGDVPEVDVAGARAAGVAPVLIARDGAASGAPPGVPVIRSLTELLRIAQYPPGAR
jgi:putative hydrolase of the HAD superfamily